MLAERQSTSAVAAGRRGAIRAYLAMRVGFWRALLEMLLAVNVFGIICMLIGARLFPAGGDLLLYLGLIFYGLAAWRLAPGSGGLLRRGLRVSAWLLLFGALNGLLGWLIIVSFPWTVQFLGVSFEQMEIELGIYVVSAELLVASLFLPVRLLLALWSLGQRRLRWRLAFSYLIVGLLTVTVVPLALLIYIAFVSLVAAPALILPQDLAPRLTEALGPSVRGGLTPAQASRLLDGLIDGTTLLPLATDQRIGDLGDLRAGGVRRLTLVGADGQVLGSAGVNPWPRGEARSAAPALQLLLDRARADVACTAGYPTGGALPDTVVCPIAGLADAPPTLLIVESSVDSSTQLGAAFVRVVTVTLLGGSLLLNLLLFIVLALIPLVLGAGYMLARQITRRVERLTAATADVAAGDLGRRVPVDTDDEIGRLARDFNAMAGQLAERERALGASAARAEELLRVNRRLVADVSHELRNPLATLRGYLEALSQSHADRLPAHDMQVINAEVLRLSGLVDDLFTLARAEAQQLPLSLAPVDTGALLTRLAETLAPLARRERQIELVAQVPPGLPPARADATRLEQMLRNLIQNALRHTPAGGIVALEARLDAGVLELSVSDTGLGIAPADLPHIFERFYRGDASRARETGGAGLGLALVHELATAMGGSVAVTSTPGRGSSFVVRLAQNML